MGGILSTIAPGIPTTLYGRLLSGLYKFKHISCNVKGVYTNTAMVDAYRGAGRPEATYVVERVVDLVAKKLGMDPVDVRKKNFVQPDEFPFLPADDITKVCPMIVEIMISHLIKPLKCSIMKNLELNKRLLEMKGSF